MTTVDDGSYMFGPQVWNIVVNQLGNLLESGAGFFGGASFMACGTAVDQVCESR